ncbi:glycerophosphodiester phosphodiesterase [Cyclobacterium xiamenense]|uniref:glycerophosphodiester phosphodiesterase n=1 Tax=Cyclobacterium xiamenense TaxID=1297121 RepID=UPI0035CEFF08
MIEKKAILGGFCLMLIASCLSAQELDMPNRGFCAHRGAMATHPENTLPALLAAVRMGAQMIEFDVQFSKDSALVLMHDATVDRTSDGTGAVAELTLSELKELDAGSWMDPAFAGTRIPTLEEVLAVMPRNTWLNIHIKGGHEIGKRVARLLVAKGRTQQAFLAVSAEARAGARSVLESIKICNMERQTGGADYVSSTIAMEADFIQLRGPVRRAFKRYVRILHENGIKVNYFGTDDPETLQRLFAWGIDFPLVNDISAAAQQTEKLGLQRVIPIY